MATNEATTQDIGDDDLDALMAQIDQPAIDQETMEALERKSSSNDIGIRRRMALVAVSTGCNKLADLSHQEPKAFGEMRRGISEYREHVQGLLELVNAAYLRMTVSDLRPGQDSSKDEAFCELGKH